MSAARRKRVLIPLGIATVSSAPVDDPLHYECLRGLSGAFADVCERAGAVFVGVAEPLRASRAWMAQSAEGDGAHPAADGYTVFADLVLAAGWANVLAPSQEPPPRR